MRTHIKNIVLGVGIVGLSLLGTSFYFLDREELSNMENYNVFFLGAGINTRHYTPAMQQANSLFESRCSTCHGLEDSIKASGVLPSYWETTVKDMLNKPNSGMTADEAKTITDFLIYDSAIRRKREVKKQLAELSPEQQKAEQDKIDQIVQGAN